MRMNRKPETAGTAFLILICLISLIPLHAIAVAETTVKKLTVMVYMCGSNLESLYGSASADLQEMTEAEVNGEAVSLLVMTGGSTRWNSGFDPNETVIHEIGSRGRRIIFREEQKNMGQKETLAGFLRFGTENRPAENYALILWDHGGGPMEGICWDELHDSDHLTMTEMIDAIEESSFGGKNSKLAWIGFDACLMSSLEVAGQLAPYAEYMIASQAEEPPSGWNYGFLNGIENDRNGEETGRRIVDAYFENPGEELRDLTMACIRLADLQAVEESVNNLYAGISKNLTSETFSALANLRLHATGFGKSKAPVQGTSGYDLVDLLSLTNCYESVNPEAAEKVRSSIRQAVVYSRANVEDSHGLSIYHPFRNHEKFLESWNREYLSLSHCPGYASYIDAYGQIMTGEPLVRWNDLKDIGIGNLDSKAHILCPLNRMQAENMADARLVVLARNEYDAADDSYCRVYTSPDVYIEDRYAPTEEGEILLAAEYSGEVMQAANSSILMPLTDCISFRVTEDETYLVDLYPYGEDGIRPEKPIIGEYVRNPETGELKLKSYSAYDEMTGTYSPRADIDLNRYKGVAFLNEYRNPSQNAIGEILSFDSWPEDVHLDTHIDKSNYTEQDFSLIFNTGILFNKLYAAFEITDTQGNVYMTPTCSLFDEESITFENEWYRTEDSPTLEAYLSVTPDWSILALIVQNHSDCIEKYYLHSAEINGIAVEQSQIGNTDYNFTTETEEPIRPGEKGMLLLNIDPETLREKDPEAMIRTIAGTIQVVPEQKDHKGQVFGFSSSPMISAVLREGEENLFEEINIERAAAGTGVMSWKSDVTIWNGLYDGTKKLNLNIRMTNNSEKDLFYGILLDSINGVPLGRSEGQWGRNGSGEAVEEGEESDWEKISRSRTSLAPGERSKVTLSILEDDLAKIAPDIALTECRCRIITYEMTDGKEVLLSLMPVKIAMNVPLDLFYPEAMSLPSREPETESSQEREANEREIAEYLGTKLFLQRVYFSEKHTLFLLRAENRGKEKMTIVLDHAKAGDRRAEIGSRVSDFVYFLNNMIRIQHVDKPEWKYDIYAGKDVEAGETSYMYVSLWSREEESVREETCSFDILFSPEDGEIAACPVRMSPDGSPEDLDENWSWARPDGMHIEAGEPIPLSGTDNLVEKTMPDLRPEDVQTLEFRLKPENVEEMTDAYYVIFRKVSSPGRLTEMNMLDIDQRIKDQVILFPVAYGMMEIGEDGKTAYSRFPAVQLSVRSGTAGSPVPAVFISKTEEGRFRLRSSMDRFLLAIHEDLLDQGIEEILAEYDPKSGNATLVKCRGADQINADWVNLMTRIQFYLPDHAGGKEILSFMSDYFEHEMEGRESVLQIFPLAEHRIQIAIEPLEAPEECEVFFFWDHDGIRTCSRRKPLADYLQSP